MGTILVNTTSAFSDGDQITSDSLNNLIDDAILNTTAVSAGTGLTVNGTTGVLSLDSSLTGKVLTGGSLNNAPIGASTPSTGAFTTLSSSSGYTGNVTGDVTGDLTGNSAGVHTGSVTGNVTGNVTGDVTGNLSGNVTGGTGSFTTLTASDDVNFDSGTLFVDASANSVGIGTTAPEAELHVQGPAGAGAEIYLTDGDDTGGSNSLLLQQSGGISYLRNRKSTGPLYLGAGDENHLNILSNGNVGIGTASPAGLLEVNGGGTSTTGGTLIVRQDGDTNADGIALTSSHPTSHRIWKDSNGKLNIGSSSAPSSLVQDVSGNVGIGTTSPVAKLSISDGNIGIDGNNSPQQFYGAGGNVAGTNTSGGVLTVIGHSPNAVGDLSAPPYDGSNFVGASGIMARGFSESGQYRGSLEFFTKTASAANATSRMLISHDGEFRINGGGSGSIVVNDEDSSLCPTMTFLRNGGGTTTNDFIKFENSGGEVGAINATGGGYFSGNIGIGDATPSYKLDVNGTGRFVGDLTLDDELIHNLTGSGSLPGYDADGTGGTFGAVLEDGGADGSTLYMARKNSWALYLATDTNLNPQSDTGKKKVVQFADLYGQTSTQGNVVGNIAINTSSTAFNTSSDYRLKENEVDITDGIDRLKELKPYRFNFIRNPSEVVDGFFAHEVSPVVPESITGSKDAVDEDGNPEYQGIDQSKLVPLLTAALQEAVAKIEALEARVQTLEG